MREIRTSGSMRGGWVVLMSDIAHSPTLPRNLFSHKVRFAKTQRSAKPLRTNKSAARDC